MVRQQSISPRKVARAIGVSESSLKRWCDQGLIASSKTAGGHRRLTVDSVAEFLRKSGRHPVRGDLLGLPSAGIVASERTIEQSRAELYAALLASDREQCRQILFDLHFAAVPLSRICDDVIAKALHCIGDGWAAGHVQIFRERRGVGICLELLAEIRGVLPKPVESAPLAIGGAPECDAYSLPTAMVESVLIQAGWAAQSLGSRLPLATMIAAIKEQRPRLFWLSVSHLDDQQKFVEEYRDFYEQAGADVSIVVGGRALTDSVRREMKYAAFCDNLQHLESFLQGWDLLRRQTEASAAEPAAMIPHSVN